MCHALQVLSILVKTAEDLNQSQAEVELRKELKRRASKWVQRRAQPRQLQRFTLRTGASGLLKGSSWVVRTPLFGSREG